MLNHGAGIRCEKVLDLLVLERLELGRGLGTWHHGHSAGGQRATVWAMLCSVVHAEINREFRTWGSGGVGQERTNGLN